MGGQSRRPQFGAVPYAWSMAGQTQTLLQSLVATGLVPSAGPDGSSRYQTVLYVGRGVPDAWMTPGQTIAVGKLTSSYNEATGHRATYGVRISTRGDHGDRAVQVSLTGQLPGNDVQIQLPVFADAGVRGISGGRYDTATRTVTMYPGQRAATVELGQASGPTVSVQVASTVPGQHTQPTLTSGTPRPRPRPPSPPPPPSSASSCRAARARWTSSGGSSIAPGASRPGGEGPRRRGTKISCAAPPRCGTVTAKQEEPVPPG
jgi:hypothetical protein